MAFTAPISLEGAPPVSDADKGPPPAVPRVLDLERRILRQIDEPDVDPVRQGVSLNHTPCELEQSCKVRLVLRTFTTRHVSNPHRML